jgi:predicted acylesterase/phospholipase RssA
MVRKITYIAGGGGAPASYIHMGILRDLIKREITVSE